MGNSNSNIAAKKLLEAIVLSKENCGPNGICEDNIMRLDNIIERIHKIIPNYAKISDYIKNRELYTNIEGDYDVINNKLGTRDDSGKVYDGSEVPKKFWNYQKKYLDNLIEYYIQINNGFGSKRNKRIRKRSKKSRRVSIKSRRVSKKSRRMSRKSRRIQKESRRV